jgi:hypothetical protein
MWRLWHRLFGWDYVRMRIGDHAYVCRVIRDPESGRKSILLYGQHFDLVSTTFPWEALTFQPVKIDA